ncbi:MAG: alanine racemase [Rikenellaceae bacterium]|nr:alanine racemase [Rikenellaceae bacterium]
MNYTIVDIAGICGAETAGPLEGRVTDVFTDSRNTLSGAGWLFFAISGRNHNGHAYINELYGRGVRAFVIERDISIKRYPDAAFLRVESSVGALQKLAADYRRNFRGLLAAVTGSNGKTVVKEWIAALAPAGVRLFRSPRSYNSQVGVPLSVLMMEGDEEVAVIEAGISEPGEMERLARILRPDIGIITNIGDAHQENFFSLEEKALEKVNLFEVARTIIYSGGDQIVGKILQSRFAGRAELVDALGLGIDLSFLPDRASREDAALAAAFCSTAGFPAEEIRSGLRRLNPVAMRLEMKEGLYGSLIIDDTYNSDINSLAIALDHLGSVAGGKERVLILSDILQSGYGERELYGKVAKLVGSSDIERIHAVGKKISRYGDLFPPNTTLYGSPSEFLSRLDYGEIAGRAVLIKGNRGSRFENISHALELRSHTTILRVDMDAIVHNLNVHRGGLPAGTKIMAMVKASGYGNGNYELATLLQHHGVDYLAVAFADEGAELRRRGITMPIVVLNADEGSYDLMLSHGLEPEIYNFRSLDMFSSLAGRHGERKYPVHIKLDTGMHRLGFADDQTVALGNRLCELRSVVRVASIFSHMAASEAAAEDGFTLRQLASFNSMSATLTDTLGYRPLLHIANSAAAERFPEAALDMVRLGIGLYGVGTREDLGLKEVSRLETRIVQVKSLRKGDTVGYGRAGMADNGTRIATLPVGYADGIDRRLGEGRWSVAINGKAAPTIGRICMDTMMVDISGIEASEGDSAVIFGGGPGNSVQDMAALLGTIPYEIMTGISSRVKRIFIKE